jgi:hypothetical protein
MKTITWNDVSSYLDTLNGGDLIGVVSKLVLKFGISDGMANDYVLFYMGYK